MFEDLKSNVEQEKKIVAEMRTISVNLQNDPGNGEFYNESLRALADQLRLLNNVVPGLLKEWTSIVSEDVGVVATGDKKQEAVKMSYVAPESKEKKLVTINKGDKKDFLKKLKLNDDALKKIKKIKNKADGVVVQKPNAYVSFSNKIFRGISDGLAHQFDELNKDLKRANIRFLLSSYLSMAMMSMLIAFLVGGSIFGFMLYLNPNNWIYFVVPLGLVGLVMAAFYLYPSTEAGAVEKEISYELPFATIHMAAIAGSNISPSKIFKILVLSGEYKNVGAEVRKVLAQVDLYGYDLVTSLKNVATRTSNKKLAELFSGLATNISSGGALKNYLDKKSENFLVDYRLEREKYSALAGTFMDVYISILIAAPLVLMMMFIVMNVAGLGMGGLGITSLMFLAIGGIIVTNIIFIVVLNMKQPKV